MPFLISCGVSGSRPFSRVFRLPQMVIFGDEGNMAERFVEIDARVFLEGTPTSRRSFQLMGPGTRGFFWNLVCEPRCLRTAQLPKASNMLPCLRYRARRLNFPVPL